MPLFDHHVNFGASTVTNNPGTGGTTITITTGESVRLPPAPFNATVFPSSATYTTMYSLAEIVRVTDVAGDVLTVTRQIEGTEAKDIASGWLIGANITAKTLMDVENLVDKTRSLRNTWIPFGDSHSQNVGTGNPIYGPWLTKPSYVSGFGYMSWANYKLGARMRMDKNFGVSGDTSAMMADRIEDVLARTDVVDWVMFEGVGGNDHGVSGLSDATSAAGTINNIESMVDQILAEGMRVVLFTQTPRDDGEDGTITGLGGDVATRRANYRRNISDTNQAIREMALRKRGVVLFDALKLCIDANTGKWRTDYKWDTPGMHPNFIGSYYLGRALASLLSPLVPYSDGLLNNKFDPLDLLAGIGFFTGAPTAGVAGGWASSVTAGSAAFSIVPSSDYALGNWQQITLTADGSNAAIYCASPALTPGQAYYAEVEVDTDAGDWENVTNFGLNIASYSDVNLSAVGLTSDGVTPDPLYANPGPGVIRTVPITPQSAVTGGFVMFWIKGDAGTTVRIRRLAFRKATI